MNWSYIASIINSSLRMTTPILFLTLGSLLCVRVNVFNIALEGQMLISCFVSIVVNYFTHNEILALAAGVAAGTLVGVFVGFMQIKLNAPPVVVGTALNLLITSGTTFLMYILFGVRGTLSGNDMVSLSKINVESLGKMPFLQRVLENLSYLDIMVYLAAVILYFFLFKTVAGFHTLSVGINKEAAVSLGIKAERIQLGALAASGLLCGFGGVALCMGQVTMFTEGMSSGRGYIALAAASLGQAHPILAIFASLFFGIAQSLATAMQNVIKSQITAAIPYVLTVAALAVYGGMKNAKRKKAHQAG